VDTFEDSRSGASDRFEAFHETERHPLDTLEFSSGGRFDHPDRRYSAAVTTRSAGAKRTSDLARERYDDTEVPALVSL